MRICLGIVFAAALIALISRGTRTKSESDKCDAPLRKMSKKGKQVKPKATAAAKTTASSVITPANPLRELVSHLLSQAETSVLGPKKVLSQEKHDKSVAALESTLRSIAKEPKTTEMQRHAVVMVTQLQINSGLTGVDARKIMALIFTFFIIEIQRHWRNYAIAPEDVHPDFVRPPPLPNSVCFRSRNHHYALVFNFVFLRCLPAAVLAQLNAHFLLQNYDILYNYLCSTWSVLCVHFVD